MLSGAAHKLLTRPSLWPLSLQDTYNWAADKLSGAATETQKSASPMISDADKQASKAQTEAKGYLQTAADTVKVGARHTRQQDVTLTSQQGTVAGWSFRIQISISTCIDALNCSLADDDEQVIRSFVCGYWHGVLYGC